MTIAEQSPPIDVNPIVSSEIFNGHENATFWIGRIESDDPQNYNALARLRAKVYVEDMGFLSPDDIDASSGTELDQDDERSVHFGAIEHTAYDGPALARVVASGRLIVKRTVEDLLPIETSFPELFADQPIATDTVEVSRFISRHESKLTQHMLALAIIRAMTYYSVNEGQQSSYAIIERPLLKLLSKIGLPLDVLGEPKDSIEPGGIRQLYPVLINQQEIVASVTKDARNTFSLREFFEVEADNKGLGFYAPSLTGGQQ